MTRLLVDTHALLWWLADDPALPPSARELIADPAHELLVSSASVWEMAIKRSLGKLETPDDLPATIEAESFTWLPVRPEHAWAVRELPPHHGDPFDRLLVAQALTEGLTVITSDPDFGPYGVAIAW